VKFIEYNIALKSINDSFTLIPYCCTHWDSDECDRRLFWEFTDRATEKDVYTLGLGDYFDFARSKYRVGLSSFKPDNTSSQAIDSAVHARTLEYAKEAESLLTSRSLGLIEGNHYWKFTDNDASRNVLSGETQASHLCKLYKIQYLAELAVITVNVSFKDIKEYHDKYVIYASHGTKTGGSTLSSDLGNMERKVEPMLEADMYVTGHTHRRLSYFIPKMIPQGTRFVEKPHLLIKAGSFLRGFVNDKVTYASEAGYRPLDLGWVEVKFDYRIRGEKFLRRVTTEIARDYTIGTVAKGGKLK
jgi:hypothetical protein